MKTIKTFITVAEFLENGGQLVWGRQLFKPRSAHATPVTIVPFAQFAYRGGHAAPDRLYLLPIKENVHCLTTDTFVEIDCKKIYV